jgi:mono/diheme cytochrome c family protein
MKRWNGTRITGMLLVAILCLAAGIAGCAAGKAAIPTAEELYAGGALPMGADLDALRRGRAIFVTECAACHRLFPPNAYSPEQWRGIVKRMSRRASLGGDQTADLDIYLTAASRVKE